jgi:hypothetical protein
MWCFNMFCIVWNGRGCGSTGNPQVKGGSSLIPMVLIRKEGVEM